MKCPCCNLPLQMSERQGVEIDYCPQCRGVWLDRGELDKIIERSGVMPSQREPGYQPQGRPSRDDDDDRGYKDSPYRKKKPKSFLEEIFDFG